MEARLRHPQRDITPSGGNRKKHAPKSCLLDPARLLLRRDHRDLKIGVVAAASVNDVIPLVDQPVIVQERMIRHRTVALDVKAQALTLAKKST